MIMKNHRTIASLERRSESEFGLHSKSYNVYNGNIFEQFDIAEW